MNSCLTKPAKYEIIQVNHSFACFRPCELLFLLRSSANTFITFHKTEDYQHLFNWFFLLIIESKIESLLIRLKVLFFIALCL